MRTLAARSSEIAGRMPQGHHPRLLREQIPESAHIEPYPRSCGLVIFCSFSVLFSPWSPPWEPFYSAGSLYGASTQRGLDGCRLRDRSVTSCSISQSLDDDAADHAVSAFNIVNAESNSIAVTEIELSEIAVKMLL